MLTRPPSLLATIGVALLSLAAACAPAGTSSSSAPSPASSPSAPVNEPNYPLPDVSLLDCGPAPDAGPVYLEGQLTHRPRLTRPGRIDYPGGLQAAGVPGKVKFAFVIDSVGKVVAGSVRTLSATDRGFVEPARGMVVSSRFVPGTLEGHAVAVCTAQAINFSVH